MLLLQPLDAQGNASGKALYLAAGTLSLGRDEGCQVQLHGNSISREHAQLVVSPDVQGVLAAEIRGGSLGQMPPSRLRSLLLCIWQLPQLTDTCMQTPASPAPARQAD